MHTERRLFQVPRQLPINCVVAINLMSCNILLTQLTISLSSPTGLAPPPPAAPWLSNHALTFTRTSPKTGINSKTTFGFLMQVPTQSWSFLPLLVVCVEVTWLTLAWRTRMWGGLSPRGSSWSVPGSKFMVGLVCWVLDWLTDVWWILKWWMAVMWNDEAWFWSRSTFYNTLPVVGRSNSKQPTIIIVARMM